ncbi:hypothetical protein GDO86_002375 [Hymenochirus boettgeri]|uniref:Uncharacterized protein n=1 Tax=Hymenochirus boettgeri TaxID=247094 RepID=A0A8T2KI61_9PIPI|nr:hypothetical protein GDO86_002375 [Hymenochirus boettgeri]
MFSSVCLRSNSKLWDFLRPSLQSTDGNLQGVKTILVLRDLDDCTSRARASTNLPLASLFLSMVKLWFSKDPSNHFDLTFFSIRKCSLQFGKSFVNGF